MRQRLKLCFGLMKHDSEINQDKPAGTNCPKPSLDKLAKIYIMTFNSSTSSKPIPPELFVLFFKIVEAYFTNKR